MSAFLLCYLSQSSIDTQNVVLLPQILLHKVVQVWSVIPSQLFGTFDWQA